MAGRSRKTYKGAGHWVGAISTEVEEEELEALNDRMDAQGLPRGVLAFDFANPISGEQKAVFDLAWPERVQEELSQPVAVLLNEETEAVGIASKVGFRCFTTTGDFKDYVEQEILAAKVKASLRRRWLPPESATFGYSVAVPVWVLAFGRSMVL